MNRKLVIALAIAGLAPWSAHAFIDERSKPKQDDSAAAWEQLGVSKKPSAAAATKSSTDNGSQAKKEGRLATISTESATTVSPASIQLSSAAPSYGVSGDFSQPMWQTKYPGPYGKMNLSDALIAQIVPVAGAAIELSGQPDLLDKKVVVGKGLNRKDTLQDMAEQASVSVTVNGTIVSISAEPVVSTATARTAETSHKAKSGFADASIPVQVAPPAKPKESKTWKIDPGTMLSTAVMIWADQWGWKVVWQAQIDYRIEAPISLSGDFLDGISEVIEAYQSSNRPLWGDWNDTQKVLVIREPGGAR